jgi:hypothetical protein
MRLNEGDKVASIARIIGDEDEIDDEIDEE